MVCQICGRPALHKFALTERKSQRTYTIWRCNACRCDFLYPYRAQAIRNAHDQFSFWTENLESKVANGFVRLFRRCVPLQKGHVLDMGCGEGHFVKRLAQDGYLAEGMDTEHNSIQTAKKFYPSCNFIWTDIDSFKPKHLYDAVTLWQVLEHIPDPMQAVRIMRRWLRPKGYLLVNVPHTNDLMKGIALIPYFLFRWTRPLQLFYSADHVNHFSEKGLRELFKRCGFSVHSVKQSESYITLFSLSRFPLLLRPLLKILAKTSRLVKREAVITLVAQKTNAPDELFAEAPSKGGEVDQAP